MTSREHAVEADCEHHRAQHRVLTAADVHEVLLRRTAATAPVAIITAPAGTFLALAARLQVLIQRLLVTAATADHEARGNRRSDQHDGDDQRIRRVVVEHGDERALG